MNSQRHIHRLRVQLLAMSSLSQRALDYSVKGYEFRNLDFARQVATANNELEEHYRRIKDLSREAVNGGIANASDFRFAFAALSIAAALHVTYSAAVEIAQSTMHLLEGSGIEKSDLLEKMGQALNASMRLCIIALLDRDACHARTVLRNEKEAVHLLKFGAGTESHSDRWVGPQKDFECAVTRGLAEVGKQAHEMADALLFWLEGNNTAWAVSLSDVSHLSREVPRAQQEEDATLYVQSKPDLGPKTSQSFSC
jgi:hypothetical protein